MAATKVEDVKWGPDPSAPPIVALDYGYDRDGTLIDPPGREKLGAGLNLAHIAFNYGVLRSGQDPQETKEWRGPARGWLRFITNRQNPSRLTEYAQRTVDDAYEENERWDELHTDELTGLPNRKRWLMDVIQAYKWVNKPVENKESQQEGERALVAVFADLDGFKNLNDEKGHEAGNNGIVRFVRQFAGLLRRKGRGSAAHDLAARLHGDEMLGNCRIVAKDVEEVARGMVVRLQERLDQGAPAINEELAKLPNKNPSSNYVPNVGTSVGYAVLRRGDSLEDFLDRADTAMYAVKAARKDKITEEEVRDWSRSQLETAKEMAAILAEMPGERRAYLSVLRLIETRERVLTQSV